MALQQTLTSPTRTLFVFSPRNPLTNAKIPTLSLSARSFHPVPTTKQSRFTRSLKCSVDSHYNQAVEYAKPAEIPWSKELCNAVHLIGVVGAPVEVRHLPSGKVLAWTRLGVKKSATDTSWINLTFWEELALVASQHVEKGHQIYVSGRLITDSVENDDGTVQTYYKVVVQQLNFIERSSTSTASYDRDSNMTVGRKYSNNAANGTGSTEELWQAFFANPLEWWDNRKNKRNPKYPDFKHKDTGEALWIEGRYNPPWVKSQLAVLDAQMRSLQDRDSGLHLSSMTSDDLLSF